MLFRNGATFFFLINNYPCVAVEPLRLYLSNELIDPAVDTTTQ